MAANRTSPLRIVLSVVEVTVTLLAGLSGVSLALEYGFPADERPLSLTLLHGVQWAAVGTFVLAQALRVGSAHNRLEAVKADALNLGILVIGGGLLLVARETTRTAGAIYIFVIQGLMLARLAGEMVTFNLSLSQSKLHPARVVVLSFVAVILVGTLLLALPNATHGPAVYTDTPTQTARHMLKCLFTATSATCVTGLVVYDTARDFTLFGQVVILVLMQLGGLGIMIAGTVVGLVFGRQLSLRQSLALQDTLAHETVGRIGRAVRFIVVTTFMFEAAGAIVLYSMWPPTIESTGLRWFHSIFHAVSGFCNAGFALQSDSLVGLRGEWQVYGVIMPLIVLGGLGFPVLENLTHVGLARGRCFLEALRDRRAGRTPKPILSGPGITLHSKLVLTTTALLIFIGAALIWLFETGPPFASARRIDTSQNDSSRLAHMSPGRRAVAALFQSITTRTAGFNTVPLYGSPDSESVTPATHFLMCVLMAVGGSPGSTAGGMKTVTLAVLLVGVGSTLRRRGRVEVFSRSLPLLLIRRAAVITVLMGMTVSGFVLLLCYTEPASLREVLFEVVSACSTVGLTAGLTPRLTDIGQAIIILAMFVGRLGPLTLLIALTEREKPVRYEYPEESVIIG